jgi:exopolyphosphatase/guanosine-5'-triphosphate,3'-diphosphate pyrophosphatase
VVRSNHEREATRILAKSDTSTSPVLAAIDAGSNGMRLALARLERGTLTEIESIREPVRLGADAFSMGHLGEPTLAAAVAAFERYAARIEAEGATHVRAVATSAAREADNGKVLVARVRAATGIRLEIIDGLEEAQLVLAGVASAVDISKSRAILVDMGGGSVEVTVARNGLALGCETLGLGAVRLMAILAQTGGHERDVEKLFEPFRGAAAALVRAELGGKAPEIGVGTGGNLECLGRLRGPLLGKQKLGKVKLSDLDPMIEKLTAMTPAERTVGLGLRPDRADVIAIAAMVLRNVMKEIGVSKLATPGVGVNQGVLRKLTDYLAEGR